MPKDLFERLNKIATENYLGWRCQSADRPTKRAYICIDPAQSHEGDDGLFHSVKSKEDYRQSFGSRVQPFRKV